jgi:hypothetical protein
MKKTILSLLFVAMALCASAQEKPRENGYKREGKTFIQTDTPIMRGDQVTPYVWRDSNGKEYPIVLHTYTKGEKAGRTTAYVIRVSAKTNKQYRYFLPDGEKIAEEIINENNNETAKR